MHVYQSQANKILAVREWRTLQKFAQPVLIKGDVYQAIYVSDQTQAALKNAENLNLSLMTAQLYMHKQQGHFNKNDAVHILCVNEPSWLMDDFDLTEGEIFKIVLRRNQQTSSDAQVVEQNKGTWQ